MNLVWPIAAVVSVCVCVLFELLTIRREKKIRKETHQGFGDLQERFFSRMLLIAALSSLLLAFFIIAMHQKWSVPKETVAFFLDVPSDEKVFSEEKGALQEVLTGLKGESVSLYEYSDGFFSCVVPETVDRIFFSMMVEGLHSSSNEALNLSQIQKKILQKDPSSWVIVITSRPLDKGKDILEGLSLITTELPDCSLVSFDGGEKYKESSFDSLTTRISSRILRSQETPEIDFFEKVLCAISIAVSWISCIYWRRRVAPLFWIGVFFVSTHIWAGSENQENYIVSQAIDIAKQGDFDAAKQRLEEILPSLVSEQARDAIIYDLALLSYLQGDDQGCISWLESKPDFQKNDKKFVEACSSLKVLALVRLTEKGVYTDPWRESLAEEVKKSPFLPQSIVDRAATTFLIPPGRGGLQDEIEREMVFFMQDMQYFLGDKSLSFLIQKNLQEVEDGLKKNFPDGVVSLFRKTCFGSLEKNCRLYTFQLWYFLSRYSSLNEGIQFLFDDAVQTANEAAFFQIPKELVQTKLFTIESLLRVLLEKKQAEEFIPKKGESLEKLSGEWYVKSKMWELHGKNFPEGIVAFLTGELETKANEAVRADLARAIVSSYHLSRTLVDLEHVFWSIFSLCKDKEWALGLVIERGEKFPQVWEKGIASLLEEKKDEFQLNLQDKLSAYDILLVARMAQLNICPCGITQEAVSYVDHLMSLFTQINEHIKNPEKTTFLTLKMIFAQQKIFAKKLVDLQVFQDDYTKRIDYQNAIQEWIHISQGLEERMTYESMFRLPKIQDEVMQCHDILLRIRNMLDEKEPTAPVENKVFENSNEQRSSISESQAVRLFQEMDRLDRKLYGE